MPNTDHRMGYSPAMREDFEAPCWWESTPRYPLGWPRREMDAAANKCMGPARLGRYTTRDSGRCMTPGDVIAMALEAPQAAPGEPAQPQVMVTVPNGAGCAFSLDLVRRPVETLRTLSPAAEWPFAAQGWRNGDGGLGAQCERVRLEKLKAAEHERWLQRQQALGHDIIDGMVRA